MERGTNEAREGDRVPADEHDLGLERDSDVAQRAPDRRGPFYRPNLRWG